MVLSLKELLNGRRIMITGATGLIGSSLIKTLIRLNDKENLDLHILALVRSQEKARLIFGEEFYSNMLKFVGGGCGATP